MTSERKEVRDVNRSELLARIQEVGAIQGAVRAEAVLRTVLDALRPEMTPEQARWLRSGPPVEFPAAREATPEGSGDLFEREEMLCEEEACETR